MEMRHTCQLRLHKYRDGAVRLAALIVIGMLVHPDKARLFFDVPAARWLIYSGFGVLAAIINRPRLLTKREGYVLLAAMFMGLVVADLRFDWAALIIWLPMSISDFLAGKIDTFGVRISFVLGLLLAAVAVSWGIRFDPSFMGFIESQLFVAAWIFAVNGLAEIADRHGEHVPVLANRYIYDIGCAIFLLLSRPAHEINVFLLFMTYSLFYRSTNLLLLLSFPDRVIDHAHTAQ